MNKVHLNGKITDITTLDKVIYITILCRNASGKGEFIPVTVFNTNFFNRYFYKDKWITIVGHAQMNGHKKDEYKKLEIIADEIYFSGDATEIDLLVNQELAEKKTKVIPYVPT